MSNGYDFFGTTGGQGAPSSSVGMRAAPAPVDRWGMPARPTDLFAAAPQVPPAKRSKKAPLVIGVIVLAAAIVAGAVFYLNRGRPIALPATAAGLSELTTLTSSEKSAIKNGEKEMAKRAQVHDIASRFYGSDSGQALFVVAGRIDGAQTNMQDAEQQFAAAVAGTNTGLSAATVSAGDSDYECLWSAANGHSFSVCFWWSDRSLLVGMGVDFDAQSTADALASVKAYAALK